MTNKALFADKIFYHIYPLGLCGAPEINDHQAAPVSRILKLMNWLPHIERCGANAIYLGPVFESERHGYDTVDYHSVDRRLGTSEDLRQLAKACRERGIALVFDAVFNHVSRRFFAFQDVLQHGAGSRYSDWFSGLEFDRPGPDGMPFHYECWDGHPSLVKLNLANPDVRAHLFSAVRQWIEQFDISGLRLDAADVMDTVFLRDLVEFAKGFSSDFWLMGEIVRDDYRRLLDESNLDSVTNYECFKGLYSSHNDNNYFEIAHSLERLFAPGGLCEGLALYSFADNHDVDRVATLLNKQAHLNPLYILLFTMPGIPSLYYGSEWAITGRKENGSDAALRPALELEAMQSNPTQDLVDTIARLASIRHQCPSLQQGDYRALHIDHEQFAFSRSLTDAAQAIVIVNSANEPVELELNSRKPGMQFKDLLNSRCVRTNEQGIFTTKCEPCWGQIWFSA